MCALVEVTSDLSVMKFLKSIGCCPVGTPACANQSRMASAESGSVLTSILPGDAIGREEQL